MAPLGVIRLLLANPARSDCESCSEVVPSDCRASGLKGGCAEHAGTSRGGLRIIRHMDTISTAVARTSITANTTRDPNGASPGAILANQRGAGPEEFGTGPPRPAGQSAPAGAAAAWSGCSRLP